MSITGLELISSIPRKNGKISVLLEIDRTKENIRALVELYGDKLSLLSEQEFTALPQDRFFLLLDIQARCQKVQDLITAELHPIPTPLAVIEEELTAEVLLAATTYVPPGPYEREPLVAADEFDRKDHIEFSKGIPENEFYGEDVE